MPRKPFAWDDLLAVEREFYDRSHAAFSRYLAVLDAASASIYGKARQDARDAVGPAAFVEYVAALKQASSDAAKKLPAPYRRLFSACRRHDAAYERLRIRGCAKRKAYEEARMQLLRAQKVTL
jgi:hypothetical protein